MLTCKEASELTSAGYDRDLRLRERMALRLHLMMCVHCRRFARQLALIQNLVGTRTDEDWLLAYETRLPAETRKRIAKNLVNSTLKGNG
ncbi:MAG: zf-HC2 domain-containing protein [Gammaproteobacteria bacterium]